MGEVELFGTFFEEVTGGKLTEPQLAAFVKVVEQVRRTEREVIA